MPEYPSDEGIPLDGAVGSVGDLGEHAPFAGDQRFLRVAVFGDGVSDSNTMGLAEDVRLLVELFIRDPALISREMPPTDPTASADAGADIEIALHGLNLGPAEDRKLHRLICDLVRARAAAGETSK